MRLIDADELLILEAAAYVKAQAKTSDKITRLVNQVVHKKLQMLVSDAPTAYDVDKVVEQLGKKQNNKGFGGTIQEIFYDSGLEDAIEIVKGGGMND